MPFRVSAQALQTRSRHACFPRLLAPNKDREIGGGGATRQPGQVRKEAALTRSGSGRSSVSYLFFRANRARWANPLLRWNSPPYPESLDLDRRARGWKNHHGADSRPRAELRIA